jgi:radical SAM superfamily enzyme YgiQ (UPF0313 family)
MRHILLVKPKDRVFQKLAEGALGAWGERKRQLVPLDIATIAALTPDDLNVDLWDEQIRGEIADTTELGTSYDLVGVTAACLDRTRAIQIGRVFRKKGIPVVVGGIGVSATPELYRDHFDVLFVGEAEYTWPRFLAEFRAGRHRNLYRQVTRVDLCDSPTPKWDKIAADIPNYFMGAVQIARGCTFDCEFCDIIHIFGRGQRLKEIPQVVEEIRRLERMGVRSVYLLADNFFGDQRYAKDVTRALATLNNSFRQPLLFVASMTVNVAEDEEMLELMAEANFTHVIMGIETPNRESLRETNKLQNIRVDVAEAVRRAQGHGLSVIGNFIVGFDHDDTSIFQQQFEFIQEECIPIASLYVLRAFRGTKLWVRMHKEKRLLYDPRLEEAASLGMAAFTNVIPKRMTTAELMVGYRDLMGKLYAWANFEARVRGMVARMPRVTGKRRRRSGRLLRGKLGALLWGLATDPALRHMVWRLLKDKQTRGAGIRLLFFAWSRNPNLAVRIFVYVLYNHAMNLYVLPTMAQEIEAEIRRIATQGLMPPEPTVFTVPDNFRAAYEGVFPELYAHVSRGLREKSRTDVALVEVISDFLTRCGPGFRQMENHHRVLLHELCDRTIAKENAAALQAQKDEQTGEGVVQAGPTDEPLPDIVRSRLAEAVLRHVERDLRGLKPAA